MNQLQEHEGLSGRFASYITSDPAILKFVDEHIEESPQGIRIGASIFGIGVGSVIVTKPKDKVYIFHNSDGEVMVWVVDGPLSFFPHWAVQKGLLDVYLREASYID